MVLLLVLVLAVAFVIGLAGATSDDGLPSDAQVDLQRSVEGGEINLGSTASKLHEKLRTNLLEAHATKEHNQMHRPWHRR